MHGRGRVPATLLARALAGALVLAGAFACSKDPLSGLWFACDPDAADPCKPGCRCVPADGATYRGVCLCGGEDLPAPADPPEGDAAADEGDAAADEGDAAADEGEGDAEAGEDLPADVTDPAGDLPPPRCSSAKDCEGRIVSGPCTGADCEGGMCVPVPANEGGACDADGDPCTLDTCRAGACEPGSAVVCEPSTDPCKDNLCDPVTGQCAPSPVADGKPCDDGDPCTAGDGCKAGKCAGGGPPPEACNGTDDDCDGQTDEEGAGGCSTFLLDSDGDGYGLAGDAKCLCGPAGSYRAVAGGDCHDGDPGVNPVAPEACNDKDDDCDGLTDEDFATKGQACDGSDGDKCQNGTYTCKADGSGVECQNESPANVQETCNGKDDDCDGLTDETWTNKGTSCFTGQGECYRTGVYVCRADGR
ncbi:MAG: putative metal-binding motif-containing protein, partial [Deltaproteobacteria bacterium]|nr:putative metal-binding motif-containing protein [Deltaproteobacteria bacterium]